MRRIRVRRWVERKCAQLDMLGNLIEELQERNIEIAGLKEELCVLSHANGLIQGSMERIKQRCNSLEDDHKRIQVKYVQLLREVRDTDKVLWKRHAAWVQELNA